MASLPHQASVRRFGPALLLLAWLPLIGDALCLVAGWLKLPWLACGLYMGIGKGLRYALVAQGALF
jgi:membrane protein YqaA with SNARE-associated domain